MSRCPAGHAFWDDELGGLCPLCLIGLSSPPMSDIGPYRRLKKLGEGGFGCVYLVRRGNESPVALKVMRNPHFCDPSAVERFRKETKIHSRLGRECFVRVDDVGEHEGCPYFTMEYMEGGTLRERMADFRGSPDRAAELMIEIVNAVELLHNDPDDPDREPILHRDLKPENILFDSAGKPRVSDFGIAKLAGTESWSLATRGFGSPWYMAPEQANSVAHTPAADVYSLGAILYELLTGQTPFEGSESQVLRKLAATNEHPAPPRQLAPRVDRYLETVVLNALEKDPSRRYASAAAFGADLKRAIERRPPEYVPQLGWGARIRSGVRRQPRRYAILAAMPFVACSVHVTRRVESDARQRDERESASMATVQAVALRYQLREYVHRLAHLARQPEIEALSKGAAALNSTKVLSDRAKGFDSLLVLASDGIRRAGSAPVLRENLERSFATRVYFREAGALAAKLCGREKSSPTVGEEVSSAYVSPPAVSDRGAWYEFTMSAPICDDHGWAGVLVGTVSASAVFRSVRLPEGDADRITVLLGPLASIHSDEGSLPGRFTFIVHPRATPGREYPLGDNESSLIRATLRPQAASLPLRSVPPLVLRDYRDPVWGSETEWSAAIAPVDSAGLVVLVQSRREPFWTSSLFERIAFTAGAPLAVGLALIGASLLAHGKKL